MLRWIISPVVLVTDVDDTEGYRAPKAHSLIEPGRGKRYQHVSAISVGTHALSLIKATDFSAIEAEGQCIDLFEGDFANTERLSLLDSTPRSRGWNNARLTRIKNKLTARGINVGDVTLDTPLETILERLCQSIGTTFHARGLRV